MEAFLFAAPIVLVASALQSCTGFGFSLMATPLLLLLFEPRTAIQLNIILSLVVSAALLPHIRAAVDRPMLRRLIASSLLGIPLGAALFAWLDPGLLKLAVGIVVLAVTGLIAARFTFTASRTGDGIAGLAAGTLTASLGIPGPALLVYFAGTALDKARVRATTLGFFLFVYAGALVAQVALASSERTIWLGALALAPIVWLGTVAGQRLFEAIDQRVFAIMINAILAGTGLYLLLASL